MYDVIIVGGGLAGLYSAYLLSLYKPLHILIIEKRDFFGGKIRTHHDTTMTVEEGAGRFNEQHELLFGLLRELNLLSKIRPIESKSTYMSSTPSPYDIETIFKKIIAFSYIDVVHDLTQLSFLEYAEKIVSVEEVQHIKNAYGYSSELTIMNAKDMIRLLYQLSPSQNFYCLHGGLSQVIERLLKKLKHVTLVQDEVVNISYKKHFLLQSKKTIYMAPICVMAVPSHALTMSFFDPIRSKLDYIKKSPLCRIYSMIQPTKLPLMTINNDLRIIIPISPTIIMSSYTDGPYAEKWKQLYDEKGVRGVNSKLHKDMKEVGLHLSLSHTKVFYWEYGVGYWGVGADSKKISQTILQPYDMNLFICGENYSYDFQQWMEGALDTSRQVVDFIKNVI